MNEKLTSGQKHFLRLINKSINSDGWAIISNMLLPAIKSTLSDEFAVIEKTNLGGRGKLTEKGKLIVMAMDYL